MVEIVCRPPRQLIILECTQYPTVEALAKTVAVIISVGESMLLKWAEGVAFSYTMVTPTSDALMKEFLEGRVYWSDVVYVLMPQYQPSIRIGSLDIPVIDVSPNLLLREAAKWMRTSAQK